MDTGNFGNKSIDKYVVMSAPTLYGQSGSFLAGFVTYPYPDQKENRFQ